MCCAACYLRQSPTLSIYRLGTTAPTARTKARCRSCDTEYIQLHMCIKCKIGLHGCTSNPILPTGTAMLDNNPMPLSSKFTDEDDQFCKACYAEELGYVPAGVDLSSVGT